MTTYFFKVELVESADNEQDAREAAAQSIFDGDDVESLAARFELVHKEEDE